MTFADWYLLCFIVGFALSVLSFLLGDFHLHLPHFGHGMHLHLGHGSGGDGAAHGGHAHGASELPVINFGTVAAFLAWFGGVGFLPTRHSGLLVLPVVVTSNIRQGGTGEMVFSQRGGGHTSGARSENGDAIERGTEVVITRYEKGIAYVRLWEEMKNEPPTGMQKQAQ